MDERRRLLERTFSREAAAESTEDHQDPITGELVRMTPSQWALAEYDRTRDPLGGEVPGSTAQQAKHAVAEQDAEMPALGVVDDTPDREDGMPGATHSVRRRGALPYVAAVGGLLLGIVGTIGVEGAMRSASTDATAGGTGSIAADSRGVSSAGPGQGDEGATLAAVTNYFASARPVHGLPPAVTRGFDASSFHQVASSVMMRESSAIYAARRLDDDYCLVAITKDGGAAETCGTLDDIARTGLELTTDAVRVTDGQELTITVTWQTDGTISWAEFPLAG